MTRQAISSKGETNIIIPINRHSIKITLNELLVNASLNLYQKSLSLQYMAINTDTFNWPTCSRTKDCAVLSSKWDICTAPLVPRFRDLGGRGGRKIIGARGG